MKMIAPIAVTGTVLTSTNVPETDYSAWSAGTAYTAGQRVTRTSVHRNFERLVDGTTATAPESDPANWLDVGPTNAWAMFDERVGTVTQRASSIVVELTPGANVTGIALLDLDVESVTVEVTVTSVVVYSATFAPMLADTPTNWFDYFYSSILTRDTLVLTDLPPYPDAVITITLESSGTAKCGSCIVGEVFNLGDTMYGAGVGIIDYSKKETDQFGATTVVERSYAKRLTPRVRMATGAIDEVARRLATRRAKATVFIGAEEYSCTVLYGWLKDWGIEISYPTVSYASLTVEGLT